MDFDEVLRDAPTRRAFMRMSGVTAIGGSQVVPVAFESGNAKA